MKTKVIDVLIVVLVVLSSYGCAAVAVGILLGCVSIFVPVMMYIPELVIVILWSILTLLIGTSVMVVATGTGII